MRWSAWRRGTWVSRAVARLNLAHDTVISAWGRLSGWVARYSSDLLIRRRIEEDAREWERSGKEASRLYRGGQLQEALSWQERRI